MQTVTQVLLEEVVRALLCHRCPHVDKFDVEDPFAAFLHLCDCLNQRVLVLLDPLQQPPTVCRLWWGANALQDLGQRRAPHQRDHRRRCDAHEVFHPMLLDAVANDGYDVLMVFLQRHRVRLRRSVVSSEENDDDVDLAALWEELCLSRRLGEELAHPA